MTIFRNFKNQSQLFMTIFRNLKINHSVLLYLVSCIDIKLLRCSTAASSALEKLKLTCITMDKKRLRINLKALEAVKERFPDPKKFINDIMEEQCQKERYPWKR